MHLKSSVTVSLIALMGLTACVDPNSYPDDPNARTKNGAVIGGLLGATVGASSSGGGSKLSRAVAGGIVGAAGGAVVGNILDRQAADLRGSLSNSNISVTNEGNFLRVNMPQDVLFATDSASLRPDLTRDIYAVSSNLQKYPNSTVEVIGHTDNTGSAAYNYDLSQRRAASVAQVLRDGGVPGNRVATIGRGFDQPVASNATAEGRAQNRRVEIIIRPTN